MSGYVSIYMRVCVFFFAGVDLHNNITGRRQADVFDLKKYSR